MITESLAAVSLGGGHPSVWGSTEMAGGGPYVILYWELEQVVPLAEPGAEAVCYLYLQGGVYKLASACSILVQSQQG